MNRPTLIREWLLAWVASAVVQTGGEASNAFVNFETALVHPVALSPHGGILAVTVRDRSPVASPQMFIRVRPNP